MASKTVSYPGGSVTVVMPDQPKPAKKKNDPDFGWVTSRLAVGGAIDSKEQAKAIADAGITAVLNVRTNQDEVPWVRKAGMVYMSNPTKDEDEEPKPWQWFHASAEFIHTEMGNSHCKLLVHCQEGLNRAPGTIYFYLRTLGFDPKACEAMIVGARPAAKGEMAWNDDAEAALKEMGYEV